MKAIILHHHLDTGGVTRIIQSQIKSLTLTQPHLELAILAGSGYSQDDSSQGTRLSLFPELSYLTAPEEDFPAILDKIRSVLSKQLADANILHVHNANLGKNPLLTLALAEQAQAGQPMLMHCHDFAEDRPENMDFISKTIARFTQIPADEIIYPKKSNCHFAVINTPDRHRLINHGIPESKLHLLPNPVELPPAGISRPDAARHIRDTLKLGDKKRIITCPVRPIRRKNLGEFVLLAAKFADTADFIVTLAPKNPVEIPQYEAWKTLAAELHLPIYFEAGSQIPFPVIMRGSDFCFSTSTREGFGMAFLEPWLYNTPVAGRNIPMVTNDFRQNNIQLPRLYDKIRVSFDNLTADFPDFSLEQQLAIVQDFHSDGKIAKIPSIDFPPGLLEPFPQDIIENNIREIRKHYSLHTYGEKLYAVYCRIAKIS
ncbi:MAG: glycosyltransferase family 4 protein [Victivallales bacterium]|nr:glycosyltransferase family 4 protein [Victivallales bacterium]